MLIKEPIWESLLEKVFSDSIFNLNYCFLTILLLQLCIRGRRGVDRYYYWCKNERTWASKSRVNCIHREFLGEWMMRYLNEQSIQPGEPYCCFGLSCQLVTKVLRYFTSSLAISSLGQAYVDFNEFKKCKELVFEKWVIIDVDESRYFHISLQGVLF